MKGAIEQARTCLAAGNQKVYDQTKRSLPAFCFMATFAPNRGKNGNRPENTWRLQSAAKLTGLVMLDYDHLDEDPRQVFARIPDHWRDDDCDSQILLAHVTPSGKGLRLVCKADAKRGNLADNQQYLNRCFGLKGDESIKNADRLSFAVSAKDIIYLDNQLFTYNNEDYDKMYGDMYRHGDSKLSKVSRSAAAKNDSVAGGAGHVQGDAQPESAPRQAFVDAWLKKNGTPQPGARHLSALKLAADLRYVCDNDAAKIKQSLLTAPFVQDIIKERGEGEIDDICADVVTRKMNLTMPKKVAELMDGSGEEEGGQKLRDDMMAKYTEFWNRLEPLLDGPYELATYRMDDMNKLGGVFAAGAMLCTLMTRCWYRHFNGEEQRMNPQVYLIGDPASGKGEAERMDQIILAPVIAADRVGREAEAEYKRQQKERATSSKAQKGEALKRPEFPIRYLPSRTSNAVFFRRAKNAVEDVNGEKRFLHLYTFDSELDGNTTAQSGGSWIGKHDIELKAFHNEFTGVDFANSDSVNEIIQVFYNSVCTGTPISLSRKITPRNINDGLCSRLAVFKMLSDNFKMIGRGNRNLNAEKRCQLKQWAFKFDKLEGEMPIKRLVDHVYTLCEQSALQAEAEQDNVLDYLRKRAVFYATWFTVPRIAARAISEAEKKKEPDAMQLMQVEDADLDFATLIYDAVIYWQDFFFGRQLQECWENAARDLKPRARNTNNALAYNTLPSEFTAQQANDELHVSINACYTQLNRWVKEGFIERVKKGEYKKIKQII
ncbi:MAG: hypothetical protein K5896_02940 [Prevotella sp.]|nr:hypothetical protein [Prevotella sp.]